MTTLSKQLPTTIEEGHRVILELNQIIRQVLERVEKLEQENRELRARLNSNSNNSSKPPSSDFKKNKKLSSGKSSGGQTGHPGHFRKLMDVDEVQRNNSL